MKLGRLFIDKHDYHVFAKRRLSTGIVCAAKMKPRKLQTLFAVDSFSGIGLRNQKISGSKFLLSNHASSKP